MLRRSAGTAPPSTLTQVGMSARVKAGFDALHGSLILIHSQIWNSQIATPSVRTGYRYELEVLYMEHSVDMRVSELEKKHQMLKLQVARLERRAHLTPVEQRQVADLKKLKLQAKDELMVLRERG
jgi:uncharacterized protein YdcH (DUF465 family)